MLDRLQSLGTSTANPVQGVRSRKRKYDEDKASSEPALPQSISPSRPFKDTAAGKAIRKDLLTYVAATAHAKLEKPMLSKPLTIADMLPGDVLLRYQSPKGPDERIEMAQMKPRLNGIPSSKNFGDFRIAHALLWTKNPANPGNTEARGMGEPQVVDARGGIGDTNIMSVQPTALQAGTYWVYRPTDAHLGDITAQVGMRWADEGNIPYGAQELRLIGEPTDKFIKFDEEAKEDALIFAHDAFEANPKWADNPPDTHWRLKKGAQCASLIIKAYQAAQLRIEQAKKVEAGDIDATFADALNSLTGVLANKPKGISPRTLEHLMFTSKNIDGSPQFKPLGVLTMKQEDVLYDESRIPDAPWPLGITDVPNKPPSPVADQHDDTASSSENRAFLPRNYTVPTLHNEDMSSDDDDLLENL